MRSAMKWWKTAAMTVVVLGTLAFGAAQALASAEVLSKPVNVCGPPPCSQPACNNCCINDGFDGGVCAACNCCLCF